MISLHLLAAIVTASTATYFNDPTEPPQCSFVDGITVVHYVVERHDTFHCSHSAPDGSDCSCEWTHPTHHKGGCMSLTSLNGKFLPFGGDCTDTGLNDCTD